MVASDEFTDGAKRFATRYVEFDPECQLECIADRLLGKGAGRRRVVTSYFGKAWKKSG
jgi:hypothetical protein